VQSGRLPLHYAVEYQAEVRVVKALLEAFPAAASKKTRVRGYSCGLLCRASVCTCVWLVCYVCVCKCETERVRMYVCVLVHVSCVLVHLHVHVRVRVPVCVCMCICLFVCVCVFHQSCKNSGAAGSKAFLHAFLWGGKASASCKLNI